MGQLNFDKSLALEEVDYAVEEKLETLANTMVGHAKSHAPVRKARPHQKTGVGMMPIALRGRWVGVARGTSLRAVSISTEKKRREHSNAFQRRGVLTEADVTGTVRPARFVLKAINSDELSSVALGEIRRGRGVHFSAEDGFQYGGFLKRSIQADEEVTRTGKKLKVTVTSGAPYSVHVEFGTHRSRAQPYFMAAFNYIASLVANGKDG